MNIGKAVKELRVKQGISQGDFAKRITISQTALSQLESGQTTPHQSTLDKVAKALGVSLSTLYLLAIEDVDVKEEKRAVFNELFPVIKNLLITED